MNQQRLYYGWYIVIAASLITLITAGMRMSIGFIGIVLVVSVFQLYGVAMIAGLAWAGNVALFSAILSDLYGVKLVGILYGLAFFVHQIGATISTLLGGWAYETFGTHTIAFGGAGIILFIAGFASLKIPQYLKAFMAHHERVTV